MRKTLKNMDFFRQIDENTWIDRRTDEIYKTDSLLQKVIIEYRELASELGTSEYPKQLPSIYFIREQRLLRPVLDTRIRPRQRTLFELQFDKEAGTFSNTIEEYAKELREIIKETLAKSSQINQELDSSFPRRLFEQTKDISEGEFKLRFDKVKQIQKSLNEFGLSDLKEDSHPTYKDSNAKALCDILKILRKTSSILRITRKIKNVYRNIKRKALHL